MTIDERIEKLVERLLAEGDVRFFWNSLGMKCVSWERVARLTATRRMDGVYEAGYDRDEGVADCAGDDDVWREELAGVGAGVG